MKTKLTIFLLILTANVGFSQDWNPFIFNQNSYFKQQYADSAKIENFLLDSILNIGNTQILYFNAKSDLKSDCYKNIKESYDFQWFKNPNKIDSLIKINDSLLFIADYANTLDTFIFKPYAKLNDSWITNEITIKCTGLGVLSILGNQDSIKTFTCSGNGFNGIEFILSKKYGFIKFLPLNEFLYHSVSSDFPPYFELAGYSNDITSAGYTQPDFNDYFHLNEGDVLLWRNFLEPYDITQPRITRYHVDSITASYISSDSVYYEFKQTNYNEQGSVTNVGNYSTYYLRKDEGVIVKNHTSWFGLKYDRYQPNDIFFLESLYFKVKNNDTVTYAQYQLRGLSIDTSDCMVQYMPDSDLTVKFSTREGKIFQGTFSWGESSETLIGSVINNIEYGDIEIPTGINNIASEDMKVFPNPFADYITIVSPNKKLYQIEIFDTTGNLIRKQKTYKDILGLGELCVGIYTLKITDSEARTILLKISKQ